MDQIFHHNLACCQEKGGGLKKSTQSGITCVGEVENNLKVRITSQSCYGSIKINTEWFYFSV